MMWRHKRGMRAVGTRVKLPLSRQYFRVGADGTFEIPDDTSEAEIKFLLLEAKHTCLDKPEPKPEPEPEPVQKHDWYPSDLEKVKGIGKATARKVYQQFPNPADIIGIDRPDSLKRLSIRKWYQIQDIINQKL